LAKGKEVFMKRVVSVLIAAAIGSSITIGAYELAIKENKKTVKIEYIENTPARQVVYQADGKDYFVPLDFTVPAEKVMPSVVHTSFRFPRWILVNKPQCKITINQMASKKIFAI
jgi:hypothetical protein